MTTIHSMYSDCARKNLMMDAAVMYPKGHHPAHPNFNSDLTAHATSIPRLGVWPPVKYYFVDYGISTHVQPGEHALVVGDFGIDQEVPELSRSVPYDPFKVDIFIIGNMFKKQLCEVSARSRRSSRRALDLTAVPEILKP